MMGIANMLKMVLPTFTYGEEEVLFLLGEMEARGEVMRDGESWKIAK
jgi:anaphase-promoting complex subunit 2